MSNATTHEIGPLLTLANVTGGVTTSGDFLNQACRGVKVFVNILSPASGTGLTLTIQGKDPKSGNYYTILTSAALATAGVLTVLTVYPGVTAATNVAVADVLPGTWRLSASVAAGSVINASINGCLLR